MYKILFIDEDKETLDDFLDYVEASPNKGSIEAITEMPLASIEEMIDLIIKISPDAVISDFKLNDVKEYIKYNIPYNGVDLVQGFQSIRSSFPCFVMTSFDDQAVSQSGDVNIVYIKNILYNQAETQARAKFLDRVLSQVDHYKSRIQSCEDELIQLLELRNSGKATINDEEKIIELDNFLEKAIDKKNSVPNEFKSLSNTDKLKQMLDKVDELLKKVEEKNG